MTASLDPDSPLTRSQEKCLRFISAYFDEHGWWPDTREVAAAMATKGARGSTNNAAQHLLRLQRKGYLYVHPRTARAMRFTLKGLEALRVSDP